MLKKMLILATILLSCPRALSCDPDLQEEAPLINQEAHYDKLTQAIITAALALSTRLQKANLKHGSSNETLQRFFQDSNIDLTILNTFNLENPNTNEDTIATSWRNLDHPAQMSLATSFEIPKALREKYLIESFANSDCPCSLHRGRFCSLQ